MMMPLMSLGCLWKSQVKLSRILGTLCYLVPEIQSRKVVMKNRVFNFDLVTNGHGSIIRKTTHTMLVTVSCW